MGHRGRRKKEREKGVMFFIVGLSYGLGIVWFNVTWFVNVRFGSGDVDWSKAL